MRIGGDVITAGSEVEGTLKGDLSAVINVSMVVSTYDLVAKLVPVFVAAVSSAEAVVKMFITTG